MAGSFNHMVDEKGNLDFSLLEDYGDAVEALIECWNIIFVLSSGDISKIKEVCKSLHYVVPDAKRIHRFKRGRV